MYNLHFFFTFYVKSGFERIGDDCIDIDECTIMPAICREGEICENFKNGSYKCTPISEPTETEPREPFKFVWEENCERQCLKSRQFGSGPGRISSRAGPIPKNKLDVSDPEISGKYPKLVTELLKVSKRPQVSYSAPQIDFPLK